MIVNLIDYTSNPEQKISDCAAICYDASTGAEQASRRIKSLIKRKHFSPLRFAYATFYIGEISRVCSHQLVRIAHAGILQRSQRYTTLDRSKQQFVLPESLQQDQEILYLNYRLIDEYHKLIERGIRKEDARFILPQATATELVMTGNFQMWREFLIKRMSERAQDEIREVAICIHSHLVKIAPNVFDFDATD